MSEPGPEFQRVGDWPKSIGKYRGALVLPEAEDGRLLLQLRDDLPQIAAPGKWGLFGGEIEAGETPSEAASREFAEETGLTYARSDFRPAYAALTAAPRWGLLYIFHLRLTTACDQIKVLEGAGFALATRKQAQKLDLIWYIADVLQEFWASKQD